MLWKSSDDDDDDDDDDDGNDDIEVVVNELLLGRLASDDVVIGVDGIGGVMVTASAITAAFVGMIVVAGGVSYLLPGNRAAYDGGGSKSS